MDRYDKLKRRRQLRKRPLPWSVCHPRQWDAYRWDCAVALLRRREARRK